MTEQPVGQVVGQTQTPMGHMPSPTGHKRWLCLGGSFNPIHVGHLICARSAAEIGGFDGVRLVPAAANPHKGSVELAAADERLLMCQLAVAGDLFFEVDPIELSRPGPSYTIDTANAFLARGEREVHWLIGTDHVARLHQWHRFDELVSRVRLVLMRRAGEPLNVNGLDPRVRAIVEAIVEVPQIEIRATAIRARVRSGRSVEHLVPTAVARHIESRNPYR